MSSRLTLPELSRSLNGRIASPLVQACVFNNDESVGDSRVLLQLTHPTDRGSRRVCGFVDDDGGVSGEGCEIVEGGSNETSTECWCSRTGSFALLAYPGIADASLMAHLWQREHRPMLDWLTRLCLCVSIASLLLTIVAHLVFKPSSYSDSTRTLDRVQTQLTWCLLFGQILFLIGTAGLRQIGVCTGVSIGTFYAFLAVFCWLLCEGFCYTVTIYFALPGETKLSGILRLPLMLSFAYVTPAVIVAVTAFARPDRLIHTVRVVNSTLHPVTQPASCWLSNKEHTNMAFLVPAMLVSCINAALIVAVILRVFRTNEPELTRHRQELPNAMTRTRMSLLLVCLLGVTWLTSAMLYAAVAMESAWLFLLLQYAFVLLNGTQGCGIFAIRVLFSGSFWTAWRRAEARRRRRREAALVAAGRKTKHQPQLRNLLSSGTTQEASSSFDLKSKSTDQTEMISKSAEQLESRSFKTVSIGELVQEF